MRSEGQFLNERGFTCLSYLADSVVAVGGKALGPIDLYLTSLEGCPPEDPLVQCISRLRTLVAGELKKTEGKGLGHAEWKRLAKEQEQLFRNGKDPVAGNLQDALSWALGARCQNTKLRVRTYLPESYNEE